MTAAELLLEDFDVEISNTRRTLERVPNDKPDWAPHDKSMKLGKLAMHCATMPLFGYYILEDEGMDMANSKRPHASLVFESRDLCLERLDKSAAKCRSALSAASDEQLAALWPLLLWRTYDLQRLALQNLPPDVLQSLDPPHGAVGSLSPAQRAPRPRALRAIGGRAVGSEVSRRA